ncbi:LADA_0C04654g1_1 [Lachancea dasiensis]|uniref:LADA_0C04654g1_1 n=1 Tax=Lachancea dasiensis TaxID=1072105 RepID=A0A1G4IZC6_9SACH|nr:LADA_0C04654g1_1 [Lachancea dasiensis]
MSEVSKERETRALFVEEPTIRLGGKTNKVLRSAMKSQTKKAYQENEQEQVESSPLLTSTPPTVSKALVRLYPYLIIADRVLSITTWTNDDIWPSVLMVVGYITTVLYFQNILRFFGHLVFVGTLWCYSLLDSFVEESIKDKPTLDDIVHVITRVNAKADLLLSPIAVLNGNDIKRLLFTTVFLSPLYVIVTLFIFPPRRLLLFAGVYLLTYHSSWSRVSRKLLWKFKLVRLLVFYITGLDLSGINKNQGIFAAVQSKVKSLSSNRRSTEDGKPIRFTYVIYENQRRWLGIGWTSNMLSYERAAWTDEFINEAPSPEQFKLPEENMGMTWRWVDRTWRLDMTNDGAIQLPSSRSRTTAQPNTDDGFIYYDNTWKKPSTEDSFSKYTRRRRWIRTAELLKCDAFDINNLTSATSVADVAAQAVEVSGDTKARAEGVEQPSTILENVKELESYKRKVSFNDQNDVHLITPVEEVGFQRLPQSVVDDEEEESREDNGEEEEEEEEGEDKSGGQENGELDEVPTDEKDASSPTDLVTGTEVDKTAGNIGTLSSQGQKTLDVCTTIDGPAVAKNKKDV